MTREYIHIHALNLGIDSSDASLLAGLIATHKHLRSVNLDRNPAIGDKVRRSKTKNTLSHIRHTRTFPILRTFTYITHIINCTHYAHYTQYTMHAH